MNTQLSPSGHIPLNKPILDAMSEEEREFWNSFLAKVQKVVEKNVNYLVDPPYELPHELMDDFDIAISMYAGDSYCQIAQIRGLFNLPLCDA